MALLWSMDVYGLLVELTFAAVPLRGGGCVGGGLATAQREQVQMTTVEVKRVKH